MLQFHRAVPEQRVIRHNSIARSRLVGSYPNRAPRHQLSPRQIHDSRDVRRCWGRRLERVPASGVQIWVLHIDVSVALPSKNGRSELKIEPPVSWRGLDIAPRRRLAVTGILLNIGDGQSRGLVAEPYAA
jgi:hypothetical protein